MIDQYLSVVSCDLTTIRSGGNSEHPGDVRHFGMSKDGAVAWQFMLGAIQTASGPPVYHEVFDGNTEVALPLTSRP